MKLLIRPTRLLGVTLLALCGAATAPVDSPPYLRAPSVTSYARHDPEGVTILSTGRYLKPVGRHMPLAKWPHGLALSPDGSTLFIASDGVGQFVTGWEEPNPILTSLAVGGRKSNGGGAAFSPDGKTLYWSSGDSGAVYCVDVASRAITSEAVSPVKLGEPVRHSKSTQPKAHTSARRSTACPRACSGLM